MFKNMSPREKKLAMLVGGLLPIALVFWMANSFSSYYFKLRTEKRGLMNQVQDEQEKIAQLVQAQERRLYYANLSAPGDEQSRREYQNWLEREIENSKLRQDSVTSVSSSNPITAGVGQRPETVAEEFTYKVKANGTLQQIVDFLDRFHRLDVLHRIKTIEIKKTAGRDSDRTLRLDLDIQLLRLVDAPSSREFLELVREATTDSQEKMRRILARDFFGPANTPPRITTSEESFEVAEGRDTVNVNFSVKANDDDPNDLLKFEVIDSNLPGIEFVQRNPEAREASVFAPAVVPGRYRLKVAVTDSGVPQKTVEKTVNIDVTRARPRETRKPEPKFLYATTTYLIGRSGDVLFVNNKANENGMMHVKIGESFKLDDSTWTVISIEGRQVVIERKTQSGIERLTYRLGATLDQPFESSTSKTSTSLPNDARTNDEVESNATQEDEVARKRSETETHQKKDDDVEKSGDDDGVKDDDELEEDEMGDDDEDDDDEDDTDDDDTDDDDTDDDDTEEDKDDK
jgi:hypothetical protein